MARLRGLHGMLHLTSAPVEPTSACTPTASSNATTPPPLTPSNIMQGPLQETEQHMGDDLQMEWVRRLHRMFRRAVQISSNPVPTNPVSTTLHGFLRGEDATLAD